MLSKASPQKNTSITYNPQVTHTLELASEIMVGCKTTRTMLTSDVLVMDYVRAHRLNSYVSSGLHSSEVN